VLSTTSPLHRQCSDSERCTDCCRKTVRLKKQSLKPETPQILQANQETGTEYALCKVSPKSHCPQPER
jgi:hypothetical protein